MTWNVISSASPKDATAPSVQIVVGNGIEFEFIGLGSSSEHESDGEWDQLIPQQKRKFSWAKMPKLEGAKAKTKASPPKKMPMVMPPKAKVKVQKPWLKANPMTLSAAPIMPSLAPLKPSTATPVMNGSN